MFLHMGFGLPGPLWTAVGLNKLKKLRHFYARCGYTNVTSPYLAKKTKIINNFFFFRLVRPLGGDLCFPGMRKEIGGGNRGQYLYHHPIEYRNESTVHFFVMVASCVVGLYICLSNHLHHHSFLYLIFYLAPPPPTHTHTHTHTQRGGGGYVRQLFYLEPCLPTLPRNGKDANSNRFCVAQNMLLPLG